MRRFLPPLALLLVACATANPDPAHSSRLSLDWQGTYRGVLPCADCGGIETELTLLEDNGYHRSVRYLGREDYPRHDQGVFLWDESGGRITLGSGPEAPRYRVGENRLFHLDRAGERITGPLAAHYVLEKDRTDARLERREWMLTELLGEPVEPAEGRRAPSLTFDGSRGRVAGSDGCNRLMGAYRLFEGERIEFDRLAGTLMACPDMALPDRFRDMLAAAGTYRIVEGELSLFRERTAILARFRTAAP